MGTRCFAHPTGCDATLTAAGCLGFNGDRAFPSIREGLKLVLFYEGPEPIVELSVPGFLPIVSRECNKCDIVGAVYWRRCTVLGFCEMWEEWSGLLPSTCFIVMSWFPLLEMNWVRVLMHG